jgi:ribosomal protein S8
MNSIVDLVNQLNLSIKRRSKFFICKKSKLNILVLNLLLKQGFILNYFQFKFLDNKLCIYNKYYFKKPILKKIEIIKKNIFLNDLKRKGDVQTNVFYIITTNIGGLLLVSVNELMGLNWYTKFGGSILFKIVL